MASEEVTFSKHGILKIGEIFHQLPALFIPGNRGGKEGLAEAEAICRKNFSLKKMADSLNAVFLKFLKLEKSAIVLKTGRKNYLMFISRKNSPVMAKKINLNEKSAKYLAEISEFLTEKETLDFFDVLPISFLQDLEVREKQNLIFPLKFGRRNKGFILLSRELFGGKILPNELKWVSEIVALASKSLENSYLKYKLKKTRLHFETALAKKNLKFSKEIQAQKKYFAKLSHEVKTPLAIIKSYLMSAAEGEPLQYDIVANQVQALSQLLEDIVFLAKLDSGCLKLERGYVDPAALVEEINQELDLAASERGITLKNFCQKGICLSADQANLKKALGHIILNAILYNKKGGVVETYAFQKKSGVKIAILDTGIGMDKEKCRQAFTLFYRSGDRQAGGYQGNGLGLSIARQIILKHTGRIEIKSEQGKGTAVVVKLPA